MTHPCFNAVQKEHDLGGWLAEKRQQFQKVNVPEQDRLGCPFVFQDRPQRSRAARRVRNIRSLRRGSSGFLGP